MEEEMASEAVEIDHDQMQAFAGVAPRLNITPSSSHSSFLSNISLTSCIISNTRCERTVVYIFLLVTCVPVISGGAFTSIFIEDGNYNAAVFAFFTTCMSLGTTSLFVFHLLRKLEKYHDTSTLEQLKLLGMVMSVASGISLGIYTILSFFNKQSFNLHGMNFFSSAVFSGVSLATSLELFVVAQWYQNALKNASPNGIPMRTLQPTSAVIN